MSSQQPDGMWVKAEVVMALEAEIATLRQERDEAIAEHIIIKREATENLVNFARAVNERTDAQIRAEAAEAENAMLHKALDCIEQVALGKMTRDEMLAVMAPPAETDHER